MKNQLEKALSIIVFIENETGITRDELVSHESGQYLNAIRAFSWWLVKSNTSLKTPEYLNLFNRTKQPFFRGVAKISEIINDPMNTNIEREIIRLNTLYKQKFPIVCRVGNAATKSS